MEDMVFCAQKAQNSQKRGRGFCTQKAQKSARTLDAYREGSYEGFFQTFSEVLEDVKIYSIQTSINQASTLNFTYFCTL